MATVTLNGNLYNSTALADYGYLSSTVGFFAILTAMVAELDAAETILTLSAAGQPNGSLATVSGGVWTVDAPAVSFDPIMNSLFR